MDEIKVEMRRSDLWTAARQEALRWQGFLARVPLFLLTLAILYGLGVGLFRNADQLTLPLQILILIGYTAVYWVGYFVSRLIQGWMKARRLAQSLFHTIDEIKVSLSLGDKSLYLSAGEWKTTLPRPPFYVTQDFIFLDTALFSWMPIRRSVEVNQLTELMPKPIKKKGAE